MAVEDVQEPVSPIQSAEINVTGLRRIPGKIPKTALLILMVEVSAFTCFARDVTNSDLAGREIHLLWAQRSHPELHQVSQPRSPR